MSSQKYIDDQILNKQKGKRAVICGHDENLWPSSSGFPGTTDELRNIVDNYENVDVMVSSGFYIGGYRYLYLARDQDKGVVRSKRGSSGIHFIKTKQT